MPEIVNSGLCPSYIFDFCSGPVWHSLCLALHSSLSFLGHLAASVSQSSRTCNGAKFQNRTRQIQLWLKYNIDAIHGMLYLDQAGQNGVAFEWALLSLFWDPQMYIICAGYSRYVGKAIMARSLLETVLLISPYPSSECEHASGWILAAVRPKTAFK